MKAKNERQQLDKNRECAAVKRQEPPSAFSSYGRCALADALASTDDSQQGQCREAAPGQDLPTCASNQRQGLLDQQTAASQNRKAAVYQDRTAAA